MNTRVTVAICAYGRLPYLRSSVKSVLAQSYGDFKLVIYDDASPESAECLVREFPDPRLHYVRHPKNMGSMANQVNAMDMCDTEYLVLFHDDDIMMPHMLQTLVDAMDANPGAVFCGASAMASIDENGHQISRSVWPRGVGSFGQYEWIKAHMKGSIIVCPSVMYRMEIMNRHGLRFRTHVGMSADLYLWCEANTHPCTIVGLADPLMYYRRHPGQCSAALAGVESGESLAHTVQLIDSIGGIDCEVLRRTSARKMCQDVVTEILSGKRPLSDYTAIKEDIMKRYGQNWKPGLRYELKWFAKLIKAKL